MLSAPAPAGVCQLPVPGTLGPMAPVLPEEGFRFSTSRRRRHVESISDPLATRACAGDPGAGSQGGPPAAHRSDHRLLRRTPEGRRGQAGYRTAVAGCPRLLRRGVLALALLGVAPGCLQPAGARGEWTKIGRSATAPADTNHRPRTVITGHGDIVTTRWATLHRARKARNGGNTSRSSGSPHGD